MSELLILRRFGGTNGLASLRGLATAAWPGPIALMAIGRQSWFGAIAVALMLSVFSWVPVSRAAEVVTIRPDADMVDLSKTTDLLRGIVVFTAPGADGIARPIEVRARETGTYWAVVELANNGAEEQSKLLVAPRYKLESLGLLLPATGQSPVVAVSASAGERPERLRTENGDVYRLILDPGSVVTYVIELRTDHLPPLYLWNGDAYHRTEFARVTLYYRVAAAIAAILMLLGVMQFVVCRRKRRSGT